ncbi:hypothetical protein H920_08831 [Fukomys damarensis]|uniref:Uncharacterized protein n=1 Tax=Fukomys damarensis TaxID=885580 RepID=A0A091E3P9_FUKDA|nr:hypothetical protein H920_08831 [Fukomys damarensis]
MLNFGDNINLVEPTKNKESRILLAPLYAELWGPALTAAEECDTALYTKPYRKPQGSLSLDPFVLGHSDSQK